MKVKSSDRLYDAIVYVVVTFVLVVTLYPFVYVLSMSVSDPQAVVKGQVFLFPVGLDFSSYSVVFADKEIVSHYYNTIWYTVVGTFLNVLFTVVMAYPLSKKKFFARNFFTLVIVITMFFSGGLIPTYILIVKLGLYGTRWSIVLPPLIAVWNVIICRTFFQSLPEELFENARLEGASEGKILWKIVIPLSQPIIAVLTLFYGIGRWNEFFSALIFLPDSKLHPIQIYLRRILIQASPEVLQNSELVGQGVLTMLQIKYAVIIVTILPIVMLYPFLQKYFVKGVMIGALKG
jgi:putative aldouronate transport system permease protein